MQAAQPGIVLREVRAGRDLSVNQFGYTPEQLRGALVDPRQFADLQERLGVTEQALRTFFLILEREVSPDQWAERLPDIALRHKEALERLAVLKTEDPAAAARIKEARGAVKVGEYERAEALLDEAEALELAGMRATEALLREAQEAVDRRRLNVAGVRAERGEVFLIQLRYRAAAQQFAEAADLVPDSNREQRLAYRDRHAEALYRQGDEFGDNGALLEAITGYRALLEERRREREPLEWARTQAKLGIALFSLGEREPGTARLEEAVAAYRAALEERTRERVPLGWALTQMNLGNALSRLGEREPGTARLAEAVAAYRAALEELTRERVPLDWARTQMNLGSALTSLAEQSAADPETLRHAKEALEDGCEVLREVSNTYYDGYCRERLQAVITLEAALIQKAE